MLAADPIGPIQLSGSLALVGSAEEIILREPLGTHPLLITVIISLYYCNADLVTIIYDCMN